MNNNKNNQNCNNGKICSGAITDDPLKGLPIQEVISFQLVNFGNSDAINIPDSVKNWEFFQGAVLCFMLKSETKAEIVGTAVMIAPGLAVTATHNFIDEIELMKQGKAIPYCLGVRDNNLDIWMVTSMSYDHSDDTALIAIRAASKVPDDKCYYRLGITTRAPKNGEVLNIIGFRNNSVEMHDIQCVFTGNLYVSKGEVKAVYHNGRDKLLMPYSVIEIDCGSLGGMSGGAAIDKNGLLVGVISRGLETKSGDGPTYISWIVRSLNKSISIEWPTGLYKEAVSPISMDRKLLLIDRPDTISIEGDTLSYKVWFE